MYEAFFGLKRRPFLFVPDVETYFPAGCIEESCRIVENAIQKGEGISLIFGEAGIGKTLFMHRIQQSLDTEYTVVLVSNCRLESSKALFCQLSHDLYVAPFVDEIIELRLKLLDFARQEPTRGIILLFDDAQYLSQEVLEEIRLLTDPMRDSVPLFRAVLAGTMEFEETLTLPNLESFNQRVAARCYLEPFSMDETFQYITRQIDGLRITADDVNTTDVPASLFTDVAKQRIHRLTEGVPRFINQLCGTVLQIAAEKEIKQIDEVLVESAWAVVRHAVVRLVKSVDTLVNATQQAPSASAQEPVISPEEIEEIVDQKRKTFQLRPFNSIEFGTLVDSERTDSEQTDSETADSEPASAVNEYKPPYPEDDEEFSDWGESEDDTAYRDVSAYRLQIHSPIEDDMTDEAAAFTPVHDIDEEIAVEIAAVEIAVAEEPVTEKIQVPKRKLVLNFQKHRRRYRRKHLIQKIQNRLGLFAGLHQPVKSREEIPPIDESEMNTQSLQDYGAAVLDGRPPFVRKELHYAYQTNEPQPQPEKTYPDPKTGVPVILRWQPETAQEEGRFGVAYSEFMNHDTAETVPVQAKPLERIPERQPAAAKRQETIGESSVIRASLKASQDVPQNMPKVPHCLGLDEDFDESQHVAETAVSLAELFRAGSSTLQQTSESSEFQGLDAAVQRQLDAVIKRVTQAAEKIEHAAETSERAGRHVSRAAEYIETEVKSALPTYIDLFRELSEFQRQVSAELAAVRQKDSEPVKFRTFPRRQVMIERAVPTIDVELLLR